MIVVNILKRTWLWVAASVFVVFGLAVGGVFYARQHVLVLTGVDTTTMDEVRSAAIRAVPGSRLVSQIVTKSSASDLEKPETWLWDVYVRRMDLLPFAKNVLAKLVAE